MGARRSFKSGTTFDPSSLGVASAWYDVSGATNAGAGLTFTLPDQIAANNATTTTDARKPTISTAANGVPILICGGDDVLMAALSAANNSATKWWISFHARVTTAAGNPCPFSITNLAGGASARKLFAQRFSGDNMMVFQDNVTSRRGGVATMWTLNTWVHCIYELNLDSGGAEAVRHVQRRDGVVQSLTFADNDGTPGNTPVTMPTPTGLMALFAQQASGGNGWVGEIGQHIVMGNAAMAGATCCLTDTAALALSNFGRPT